MIISFVDLPSNQLNADQIKSIRQSLLASIERAKLQIKWAEAVAAWAKSIEVEYVHNLGKPKYVTPRTLPAFLKFLPDELKALGDVKLENTRHGWVELDLVPAGKDFDWNSTFNFYTDTKGYGNRISRIYLHDAPEMIKGLQAQIVNSEDYLNRLTADIKSYNKAAKKVAEAQALIKSITIPYRVKCVEDNLLLMKDLRHIHQKG